MSVPIIAGYFFLFLIGALSALFLFWLTRKKWNHSLSLSLVSALIFGLMMPWLVALTYTYRVVEIRHGILLKKRMFWGHGTYVSSDHQSFPVVENPTGSEHYFVVNSSDSGMVLEYLVYGDPDEHGVYPGSLPSVKPHSWQAFDNPPDYFPWETPPQEVYERSSIKTDYRTWLRYERPADGEQPLHLFR